MINSKRSFRALVVMLGIWCGSIPSLSSATLLVSLDTSALSGAYSVVFDLIGGSAAANNSVTISGFDFGGGTPAGSPSYACTSGTGAACSGVLGDMSSLVNLSDTDDFFNEFVQGFVAGSRLKFRVNLTTNLAGATPDAFSFFILDSAGNTIPTADPLMTDAFFVVPIDTNLPFETFASPGFGIGAPEIARIGEPDTLAVLVIGLVGMWLASGRRRRRDCVGKRPRYELAAG